MEERSLPLSVTDLPEFPHLSPEHQGQLRAMEENMRERGLPAELIASGLRSTAGLLREQEEETAPRISSDQVQAFIEANRGTPIRRRSRAVPRKETKLRTRERLQDQLIRLLMQARGANRRHEMLRIRREMLALDQGYIRRTLGQDGETLCREVNAWLIEAATRLNRD